MKTLLHAGAVAIALALAPTLVAQEAYIPGNILIMAAPAADVTVIARDLATVGGVSTGLRVDREISAPMRAWLLKFDQESVPQAEMVRRVAAHPLVQIAQNDHVIFERTVPNDTQYDQQWHHQNIGSETAWDFTTGGLTATGDTIVVCIIERSDLPHPDLIDNAWFNHAEIPNNGIDDDGNGYVDDHRGWNPANNTDQVYGGGHGTQVAGMIGAKGNNDLGVVGANWDVKMMVVNYANAQESSVIAAYTYPLVMRRRYNDSSGEQGAFVVATNASWGIDGGNPDNAPLWCAMYDTLGTAGILNCGATANNNVNIDVVGDLPTGCASDFMVSVTATNIDDIRTFSGYGATTIDVGAPGSSVRTTSMGGGYGNTSGTSFASPLTAGVIGLLYSAPCPELMDLVLSDPEAGAMYIRQALFEGVEQVGNLPGNTVTGGRINSGNSMTWLMGNCGDCPAPFSASVSHASDEQDEALFSWNSLSQGPFTVQYRPVDGEDWTVFEDVLDPTFLASGLDPCESYEFQVEAQCDSITSGYSVTVFLEPEALPTPTIEADRFPVICDGDALELTSSSASFNTWSNSEEGQSIMVTESGSYFVTVNAPCETLVSEPIEVEVLTALPPTAEDVVLAGPGSATLNATGENPLWYLEEEGGEALGEGNEWVTPFLTEPTEFWVSNMVTNGVEPQYGGPEENTNAGQYHTNGTFYLIFEANEPFTILSVKVFANGAGTRPISLIDLSDNSTVAQGNFTIPNGESRVQLNFQVPEAGEYGLRITGGNPQLWRDGDGSNPSYPYPLGDLGAITGTNITGNNALNFYYFFYDWEVQGRRVECESERVSVMVDITVGINEQDGFGVNVFPDPADRDVFFDISGPLADQELLILVRDNAGREVATKVARGGRATLTTAWLANGMYFYSIIARDRELARGKFIVLH